MKYNIFIETNHNTRSLLDRDEDTIRKIITAFKEDKESIFIEGEIFYTGKLREIQVYEFNDKDIKSGKALYVYCKHLNRLATGFFSNPYVPQDMLKEFGKKVTDTFINDDELELIESSEATDYVNVKRVKELEQIVNENYDLSRLIAILKEINICNKNKLKFAIPPLVRSIIDQVPPIFGKENFSDICGSYGSKSFKESMSILDTSSRKIADSYLHTKIRKKESALPTETQIDFKNVLDVLLQEIVRISQK